MALDWQNLDDDQYVARAGRFELVVRTGGYYNRTATWAVRDIGVPTPFLAGECSEYNSVVEAQETAEKMLQVTLESALRALRGE